MKRLLLTACLSLLALAPAGCTSQDKGPKADAPSTDAAKDEASPGAAEDAGEAPAAPALPAGEALLAECVAASGGEQAIARFESVHAKGKIDTGKQKLRGESELWWRKGGEFYVEQEIEGVGKSRAGYDGEVMWTEDPITGLRRLEGEEAASYLQSAMMFPAHQWREHFSAAVTKGKKTLEDGGEIWEVELQSADGPELTLGLDVETKLIRTMKTDQVTSMGTMPVEITVEDYGEVEGYKFAMTKRSSITGLLELEEKTTEFAANVELDPGIFAFPATRELVPADPSAQPPVEAPAPTPEKP
ncbi:hypothetical protein G6O69_08275 [Pseudenhygromyxa sp. WMMC2535]|uniref:hypothetical protein n=1 Tax=Pseudenhygromyxa sp. WMMC2535 TaxID=2712867 RepID=UPI0015579401|nr:hypothetical protein [Pseudenhygromyxa sp. WMMC2535]NVB37827.1 hypothetical protein [Pseudenhygromyxa sp. WMMC2535]